MSSQMSLYQARVMEAKRVQGLMHKRFDELAKERPQRCDLVKVKKTIRWSGSVYEETELAWARFEREGMLLSINEIRAQRGVEPATIGDVEWADQQAAGHVDYARKFSLYCAEIALTLPVKG